jgi:putative hemolysin
VNKNTPIPEYLKTVRKTDFTRMPVYDQKKEEFIGIINMFHVLSSQPANGSKTVEDFAGSPLFIPEKMPVDDIFPRMRHSRQPMALVRDDNNKVKGIITTEDILKEIVGKL